MRILLLLPTSSYRAVEFLDAAQRLGVGVTVSAEEENVLTTTNPSGYLTLNFADVERMVRQVREFAKRFPLRAVLGVDDSTTVAAARIAQALSLPSNPIEAVETARNKYLMRERFRRNGVPVPDYTLFSSDDDPTVVAQQVRFPCVLKPLMLAASQGVIRANDTGEFIPAWNRLCRIIEAQRTDPSILVESFIPGQEVALEGLVDRGELHVLTLFDKPDPLEGPFFEETIYVRPSQLSQDVQQAIVDCATRGVEALGLTVGPMHAELRINQQGPWVIEIAARPIGGRCSRSLRFVPGLSLEELIIRQALRLDLETIQPDPLPSGVMMIPIPHSGVLQRIGGLEEAKAVPGIQEILITAHLGQSLMPLPEGSQYLGFIFARERTTTAVEHALRRSHACLRLEIESLEPDQVLNFPPVEPSTCHSQRKGLPSA